MKQVHRIKCVYGLVFGMVMAVVLGVTPAVFAGEPTDFVKSKIGAVTKLFVQKATKSRSQEVEKLFGETIDLDALCQQSFGEHWNKRTADQKKEFIGVLQKMLRANYDAQVGTRTIKEGEYKIEYGKERERGDRAFVATKIVVKESTKPIDYRLLKREQGWVIYDLVLDGVSLVESYRDGYKEIVESDGWDELIKRIKEKTSELEAQARAKKV